MRLRTACADHPARPPPCPSHREYVAPAPEPLSCIFLLAAAFKQLPTRRVLIELLHKMQGLRLRQIRIGLRRLAAAQDGCKPIVPGHKPILHRRFQILDRGVHGYSETPGKPISESLITD